ncbi:MAG: CCA tRNA nucleotidyltransferase [Alphaproteobacteria bacterium]
MRLDPLRDSWMTAPEARAVLDALTKGSVEARFVGGAVRDALLQRPVADVDIATPLPPDEVTRRLEAAGLAAIPTGIEHGTVTAISNGKPFEITTLRRDVATDGRRATVAFTTDWKEDAARRDFTINALYATRDCEVFDYFDGIRDLEAGRIRFVGDPVTRIREDYLRILRLFRFHAWYGRGDIDAAALQAAVAEKSGVAKLSGERLRTELLKLLQAENPAPAIRVMAAAGILGAFLPDPFDVQRLERLVDIDRANIFPPDALLRLAALLPDEPDTAELVAERLKMSTADRERMRGLLTPNERIVPHLSDRDARKLLYRLGQQQFRDRLRLRWAEDAEISNAVRWLALLAIADAWQRPVFPLSGRDVIDAGVVKGPLVGRILSELEEWWIDSDFTEDALLLAERLKAMVQATSY